MVPRWRIELPYSPCKSDILPLNYRGLVFSQNVLLLHSYTNPNGLVRVEGFEPSISCSQSRRIKPDFPTLGYNLVLDVGVEPTMDFSGRLQICCLPVQPTQRKVFNKLPLHRFKLKTLATLCLHAGSSDYSAKTSISGSIDFSRFSMPASVPESELGQLPQAP